MSFAHSVPQALPTADTVLYTMGATLSGTAHGLLFSNISGAAATVTVKFFSQASGTTTKLLDAFPVPANGLPVVFPKPLNMVAGDQIIASGSVASAISAFVSAVTGSAAPVAAGWNPRGPYSPTATYAANDVATFLGSSFSYQFINGVGAAPGQPPTTNGVLNANWQVSALKGDSGASVVAIDKGNSGTTNQVFDFAAGGGASAQEHKLTITGACNLSFANWPTAGNLGEILIKLVNGGSAVVGFVGVTNFIKSDRSSVSTFAASGVTLQAAGTDFILVWSDDGGTTVWWRV